MAILKGKMPMIGRGHAPREITTRLPEGITFKDGKYYQDGKELEPIEEMSFKKFLESSKEKVSLEKN